MFEVSFGGHNIFVGPDWEQAKTAALEMLLAMDVGTDSAKRAQIDQAATFLEQQPEIPTNHMYRGWVGNLRIEIVNDPALAAVS